MVCPPFTGLQRHFTVNDVVRHSPLALVSPISVSRQPGFW